MNFGWESKFEKYYATLSQMQVIPLFIFPLNFLLEISRMDGWAGAINVTRPQ